MPTRRNLDLCSRLGRFAVGHIDEIAQRCNRLPTLLVELAVNIERLGCGSRASGRRLCDHRRIRRRRGACRSAEQCDRQANRAGTDRMPLPTSDQRAEDDARPQATRRECYGRNEREDTSGKRRTFIIHHAAFSVGISERVQASDATHGAGCPVITSKIARYFSEVFRTICSGKRGAGGFLSQSVVSQKSRTNCLSMLIDWRPWT